MAQAIAPKTRYDQLKSSFERFDLQNPQVYAAFEKHTFVVLQSGATQVSAGMILHLIRSDPGIRTTPHRKFKICQNHAPFYVDKFVNLNPAYAGIFKTKSQPSRNRPPRLRQVNKEGQAED